MGWLACAVYSTIPAFWLMIHPFAERWRMRHVSGGRSPYLLLVPAWIAMWAIAALASWPWRHVLLYSSFLGWVPAVLLFAAGLYLYAKSGKGFSAKQLGGVPELHGVHPEQRLATDGIRAHVRHPIHSGASVRDAGLEHWHRPRRALGATAFAIATGAVMIRMEDAELEKRFGEEYARYRRAVPAVIPSIRHV